MAELQSRHKVNIKIKMFNEKVLLSIIELIFPSLNEKDSSILLESLPSEYREDIKHNDAFLLFCKFRPESIHAEFFSSQLHKLSTFQKRGIAIILYFLSTFWGTSLLLLWPSKAFVDLSSRHRQEIMMRFLKSPLQPIRSVARTLLKFATFSVFKMQEDSFIKNGLNYSSNMPIVDKYKSFSFLNKQFEEINSTEITLNYDVVIVGSGAGC
jgi:hypothetical protein